MNNYRRACFFFFFLIAALSLSAQIRGRIIDKEKRPVEGANIVLNTQDSVFLAGTVSGKNGSFEFRTDIKTDSTNYQLIVSMVGYEKTLLRFDYLPRLVDLDAITLIENTTLEEVVVTGSRSIFGADRRLIFIPQQVVKSSVNGFDLVNKLMLPGIKVDIVNKNISKMGGGNVPIYINDKPATQADVVSLLPDEVIRVEYIDAPGVRYGNDNVEAVINFIVKRRYAGMVTGIDGTNALTTGNGNNFFYIKQNYKQSELGLNYSNEYGSVNKRYIDQHDIYVMSDGAEHHIIRDGLNTHLKYWQHRVQLTYNLSIPKKFVFEINLRGNFYNSPNRGHKQHVEETGESDYYTWTNPTEKYNSPVLDLYYNINLPKRQRIVANVVGTFIDTKYAYSYKEFDTEQFVNVAQQYGYETDGKKYSFIGEARYLKGFDALTLSAGINYRRGYTKNEYIGTNDAVNKMNDENTYLFAQISGKFSKINYIAGAGISRLNYSQGDERNTYWLLRPSFTLSYNPIKSINMRYRFFISPKSPSLSMLSNVIQQVNEFEFKQGNPNLKPYREMSNSFFLSYEGERFYLENTIGYSRSRKTIMEQIERVVNGSGRPSFIFGFDNQKGFEELWNYCSGQYHVIPEKLMVQGGISFLRYFSKGNTYTYTYNRFWEIFQADLMLGSWNVGIGWNSKEKFFSGETMSFSSEKSNLYVNYQLKSMTFGLNWSYIFSKNGDQSGERTVNEYVHKELLVFVPDYGNMISFTLAWNLNRGRKYQSPHKALSNADSDAGILKY